MVIVLASNAVDLGFEPKTVKLVFVASLLSTQYEGVRAKTAWFGIRILAEWSDMSLPGLLFQ
jgi:hypothetical protein